MQLGLNALCAGNITYQKQLIKQNFLPSHELPVCDVT
jgi:hypothetical protein